jgi:hypothetical protein
MSNFSFIDFCYARFDGRIHADCASDVSTKRIGCEAADFRYADHPKA